jgi:hypothetical protein
MNPNQFQTRSIPSNKLLSLKETCDFLGQILSEDKSDAREQALISRVILGQMKLWLNQYNLRSDKETYTEKTSEEEGSTQSGS